MPHLTSNLQAVASLFIAPTLFFPPYPCACVSPSPATNGFTPLKYTSPRKSLYLRLLYIEALITTLLKSPKENRLPPAKRKKVLVGYLESSGAIPYSDWHSLPLYIWGILIFMKEHSWIFSCLSIGSNSTDKKLLTVLLDIPVQLRQKETFFNNKVGTDKNSTTQHLNESNKEQKNLQL